MGRRDPLFLGDYPAMAVPTNAQEAGYQMAALVEDDPWTVGGSEVAEMASRERERHSDRYGMGSRGDKAKSKVTTKVDDTWLK